MRTVEAMEIGLVFWAEADAEKQLRQLEELGLRAGQLGVPPELDCHTALAGWAEALKRWDVSFSSAVVAYSGEDYSNLKTVHETVGFTAASLRAERIERTQEVSLFAQKLGLTALSCHLGFIPEDRQAPLYRELCELTQLLCGICAERGQSFVLETGQESADVLLSFIQDVGRQNLKVNFDPANMILYGSGDPVAALGKLQKHVLSVHCKDGNGPAGAGLLGKECALGDGEVDFPAFLRVLQQINYQGLLSIEREEENKEKRLADIRTAITRLKHWKSELGL